MDNPYADQSRNNHEAQITSGTESPLYEERYSLTQAPFAFLFKPGSYMKRNGIKLPQPLLVMIIWISGIAMVADQFDQNNLFGRSAGWSPTTWFELGIAAVILGFIRGMVVYGIGGLWYRLRLRMCGVKDAEWSETGRVYMISGIARHLTTILYYALGAAIYPTYDEFTQADGIYFMILPAIMVIMLVWSSITLYCGTRAVFPVKKLWAVLWYLILPILVRLSAIGIVLGLAFFQQLNPQAALDQPRSHESASFEFEYPSNWFVSKDNAIPGPEYWIEAEPIISDAYLRMTIQYKDAERDFIDEELNALLDNGVTLLSTDQKLSQLATLQGFGQQYTVDIDGGKYLLKVFISEISEHCELSTLILCHENAWDATKPGYDHILNTLSVTDPYEMEPNLSRTYTIQEEELSFDIPSNWWLTINRDDDTTAEDGSVIRGGLTIDAQTPGYGSFRVYVYNSDIAPRAELGVSISGFSESGRLENEELIDQHFGVQGFGARGQYTGVSGLEWNATILISELSDGRFIEFQAAYPTDHASMFTPGYDLIESTMQVNPDLVESP